LREGIDPFATSCQVSVIVLNYNGRHLLEACLSGVMHQTDIMYEVILVDNGSQDHSVDFVRKHFPEVRVVELPKNVGVAAGYNVGLRAAQGTYLVTLNNDAVPQAGWLSALVAAVGTYPNVGSVASLVCRADDPSMIDSAGICVDVTGSAWDRLGGYPLNASGTSVREVFGVSAAAALYCRTMLDDVGLFAEHFFAYLEDVDLAWRSRLRGWTAVIAPRAVVVHEHSATSGEGSPFKLWHLGRNRIWCLIRNYPSPACWRFFFVIVGYDIAASVFQAVYCGTWQPLRGRVNGLRAARRILQERSQMQAKRRIGWTSLVPYLNPLEGPQAVIRRYAYIKMRKQAMAR